MDKNLLFQMGPQIRALAAGNDHPALEIPFSAMIDGRRFHGKSLSLVSAKVTGLIDPQAASQPHLLSLMFEFDGFSVTLVVQATARDRPNDLGEVDFDFTQPAGAHLPQLRHILNAWIAGDLVSLGETISVANSAPPKPTPLHPAQTEGHIFYTSAIAAASIGLLALVLGLIYQQRYVQTLPDFGTVTLQGETLRAIASGQIAFLDLTAPIGQIAVAVTTTSGEVLSLTMPCDCVASSLGLRVGSTVLLGEPLLNLSAPDAQMVVMANMSPQLSFDLARGDQPELILPDGSFVSASAQQDLGATVMFVPDTALPAELVGAPIKLRLIRTSGFGGASLASFRKWLIS
jgi:mannuronan synthase